METIDIVIPWVDGNDPEWLNEKSKYSDTPGDKRDIRFRDWDNLHYLFRGIDKYMPWVNKVHFITWGHLPKWMNRANPKLSIVNHKDYIPEKYLPTFSANPIELNLHRIKDLAEQFIYFNDDIFVLKETKPIDFFQNGLPCDVLIEMPNISMFRNSTASIISNVLEIINTDFNKLIVKKKNFKKWYNLKYRKHMFHTILQSPYKQCFTGFRNQHICNSFLKTTFSEVWEKEYDILDQTCQHKFRDKRDVNQYLMRYWQLVTGKFEPRKNNLGASFSIVNDNHRACQIIRQQKMKIICLNDNGSEHIANFEKVKQEIKNAFEIILPDKCSFEK